MQGHRKNDTFLDVSSLVGDCNCNSVFAEMQFVVIGTREDFVSQNASVEITTSSPYAMLVYAIMKFGGLPIFFSLQRVTSPESLTPRTIE